MRKWPVILLLATGPARAEFFSGNDLYERMRSRDAFAHTEVLMYIAGVSDAHRSIISCPTPDVSLGQLYDMVKSYLERFPERRSRTGDSIVAAVMRPVWPCRTGSGT